MPATATAPRRDNDRWERVRRRDPSPDAPFLYGVRTTGVYCRPGCASRLPRRENVVFFVSQNEAEAAGFRACRRCRPQHPAAPAGDPRIERACRFIDGCAHAPTLAEIAAEVGLSAAHLYRLFLARVGVTPKAYVAAKRAARLRDVLQRGEAVADALLAAGYASSGRCYAEAGETLGMTPGQFRRGGARASVGFAVAKCALGRVLVAATDRGLCRVALGDSDEALRRALLDAFPNAQRVHEDAAFETLVNRVIAVIDGSEAGADLPLDIRGTAFQCRVWQALRAIPAGQTRSYAQIAAALGDERAARAVAGACAANPLAVVIPCHRVVRGDGTLSGYRWGAERKRSLLARERVV